MNRVLIWQTYLPHEDNTTLCAAVQDANGDVIGSCQLTGYGNDTPFLVSVHVRAASRRQGVAREMIQEVVERARRDFKHAICLWCKEKNLDALRLYASIGFERCYYDDGSHFLTIPLRRGLVDLVIERAKVAGGRYAVGGEPQQRPAPVEGVALA